MPFITRAVFVSTLLAVANAQGVIVTAKGTKGTSLALQIDQKNATDANFINDAELAANIVNECGRTLSAGNIDIGQNTEDAIAAGNVTQVTKSSSVAVSIRQVNAQGAGPFTCDMDQTSNSLGSGQTPLTVKESAAKNGIITLDVTMPANMTCIGGSTGNICTVRCRNAQSFGGCFAVEQTDITPNANTADNVKTAQTLDNILTQVAQDIKDFPVTVPAVDAATTENQQGTNLIEALLKNNPDVASKAATTTNTTKTKKNKNKKNSTSTAATKKNKKNSTATAKGVSAKAKKNSTASGKKNKKNNTAAAAAAAATTTKRDEMEEKRDESSLLRWARRFVVVGDAADEEEDDN